MGHTHFIWRLAGAAQRKSSLSEKRLYRHSNEEIEAGYEECDLDIFIGTNLAYKDQGRLNVAVNSLVISNICGASSTTGNHCVENELTAGKYE